MLLQMDTLMKELSVPLSRYISAFPSYRKLHPFEQSLLELTVSNMYRIHTFDVVLICSKSATTENSASLQVGLGNYESMIARVDSLRKGLQESGKGFAARANKATNKAGAVQVRNTARPKSESQGAAII